MTRPTPQTLPDKSIEEVARLVEESSLGTAGARQLRDRAATGTAVAIRARAYFADSDTGRSWWQANQRNPGALRRKARALAAAGDVEISDVLTRLADDQEGISRNAGTQREERDCQPSGHPSDSLTFETFYRRDIAPLTKILCEQAGLPWELGSKLIGQAMFKAFDDWDQLAALGDPGEWVIGYALRLYRNLSGSRQPDLEDDDLWSAGGGMQLGGGIALAACPPSASAQRTAVQVTGALAAAASQVTDTRIDADQAVTGLYSTHYRELVRLAAFLVKDTATAEEVVQDSFVAMHGQWQRLGDTEKALSFLQQSVVNRSRSVLRHRMVVDKNTPKPQADMPSAEQGAIIQLERSAVVSALRALPERQREALVLRYYGDLSEAQIASVMGISRGAVKSHTARAMCALRRVLEEA